MLIWSFRWLLLHLVTELSFSHYTYYQILGRNRWKLYFDCCVEVNNSKTVVRTLFICFSSIWVKSYRGDQMPLSKWILINLKLRLKPRGVSYLHSPYWPEGHDSTGCIITLHPIWFIASGNSFLGRLSVTSFFPIKSKITTGGQLNAV